MKGARPLTDAEVDAARGEFRGRYAARDRLLFVMGVNTGLRISELLAIRIGDVLQHGRLVEYVSLSRRHMKGKREGRTVRLNADVRLELEIWLGSLRRLDEDQALFPAQGGRGRALSYKRAWSILTGVYGRLGFQGVLGTHAARKTFASGIYRWALERRERGEIKQNEVRVVQHALGHQSVATTEKYLGFDEQLVTCAVDDLARNKEPEK